MSSNKKLIFNFGELLIYSGINQSVDLRYINPVIPYYIVDINQNHIEPDNSNSILFLDFRYVIDDKRSVFLEFLLDDFQIDDTKLDNALGLKLGLTQKLKFMNKNLNLEAEINSVSEQTYSHHGNYTYFSYNERPIGYKFGQSCNSFELNIQYDVNDYFSLIFKDIYLSKNTLNKIPYWGVEKNIEVDSIQNYQSNNFIKQLFSIGLSFKNENFSVELFYSTIPPVQYLIVEELHDSEEYIYFNLNYFFKWDDTMVYFHSSFTKR